MALPAVGAGVGSSGPVEGGAGVGVPEGSGLDGAGLVGAGLLGVGLLGAGLVGPADQEWVGRGLPVVVGRGVGLGASLTASGTVAPVAGSGSGASGTSPPPFATDGDTSGPVEPTGLGSRLDAVALGVGPADGVRVESREVRTSERGAAAALGSPASPLPVSARPSPVPPTIAAASTPIRARCAGGRGRRWAGTRGSLGSWQYAGDGATDPDPARRAGPGDEPRLPGG